MNGHTTDTMTAAALRDLDPAPGKVLTEAERERADATFARILATPSHDPVPAEPDRPRRRRARRLVPLGVVVAAGAAIPVFLLGGGSAYASWTPTPHPLGAATAASAARTCRAALQMPDRGEPTLIAERRGGWTLVLLSDGGTEGVCVMPDGLVGHDPSGREDFFGSYGADSPKAPTVARNSIAETWSSQDSTSEGVFTAVQGYVGSDVTGVTVHTPSGPDVQASVDHGRFAAWWPGEKPSSHNHSAGEGWTYTVTLADGSTRDVPPGEALR